MSVHQIGNHKLAFGFSWQPPASIPQASSKARQLKYLKSIIPTPAGYVNIRNPLGTQIGTTIDPADIGVSSAAAWLAQSQPSIVLVEQLNEDLFWLCATEDGAIFPAGDLIGNKDLIGARLDEIQSDIKGTDIELYSTCRFSNISSVTCAKFADLVDQKLHPDGIDCHPIEFRNRKKPIIATASLAVTALSMYIAIQHYTQRDQTEITEQASQMELQQAEIAQYTEKLNQNSGLLLTRLAEHIYARPLRAAGWKSVSYEWQDGIVTVVWKRAHGSIASIAGYLAPKDYALEESSGTVLEHFNLPVHISASAVPVDAMLDKHRNRHEIIDVLAQLPGIWSLGKQTKAGQFYAISASELNGTASRLHDAFTFAETISGMPLTVERIKVSLEDPFTWEIEGQYFAKIN